MRNLKHFTITLSLIALSTFLMGFDFGDAVRGITGNGGGGGGSEADAVKGIAGISLEEERSIGGSLALEIAAKSGGILKDAAMTKRVATIGRALSLYSTRPEINYTFAVLNDEDVNAISAPGGYVFVSKGLVQNCKSDQQLASVLAHEISHIARRHALKVISGKQGAKGGSMLLGTALGFAGVDTFGAESVLGSIASSIIEHGLPKSDEYDADRVGTILSYEAGFPARTLRDYLDSLKDKDSDHVFSHHPKIEDRIDRLDDQLKEMGQK